ncbi:Alanine racemase [Rhynchospora pubera]|uniref:Alanine racemase n=1 Tax=Rhynchospora pubera TaxID=906938 RepID=A0AAV8CYC4_9POAL|nr:Alanine racemase [Rhynchospora pubera]
MPCLTNEAQIKLPSFHCKSLPSLIRSCVSTPTDLSSEDEDTYYDLDTKHPTQVDDTEGAKKPGHENQLQAKSDFYSGNLNLSVFPPPLDSADNPKEEFLDATDNEDESEAFFSVKSNFSRCSSQGATASWDGNKGVTTYRSALEEFRNLEGWPFGLCRQPLVLPPLPSMPADSWMWRRNSEAKSANVAN